MGNAITFQGILKGSSDMSLTDDVFKFNWTPLSRENSVTQRSPLCINKDALHLKSITGAQYPGGIATVAAFRPWRIHGHQPSGPVIISADIVSDKRRERDSNPRYA